LTAITYAQNLCCGAQKGPALENREVFDTHLCKLLISLDIDFCFFSGQFKQTLDFQGLPARQHHLSTKLSTENLNSRGSEVKSTTYIAFLQFD